MSHKIITIGRQFGSGGSEIGELTANALGIPFYDRELIEMASQEMGIDSFDLERVDETAMSRFRILRPDPAAAINAVTGYGMPLNDSMYLTQRILIEKLAEKGPCVFVGRCADVILKDRHPCVNVFICASKKDRIARITERYFISERQAAEAIRKVDRKRRFYYESYTDAEWGSIDSHQALLNVSMLGKERTIQIIKDMYLHEEN
ncbi:MAG: cytidylate kinase-like family protein [Lachnospiraceae bacterium]|nr:cytidylate kinase-like family protein [Lachnospiraceae bacterium]